MPTRVGVAVPESRKGKETGGGKARQQFTFRMPPRRPPIHPERPYTRKIGPEGDALPPLPTATLPEPERIAPEGETRAGASPGAA